MSEATNKPKIEVPPIPEHHMQCHRNAMHCRLLEDLARSIDRDTFTVSRGAAVLMIREVIRNLEHDSHMWQTNGPAKLS